MLAVLVGGVVGVALGLLLTPLLRLSGAYFAIANLAASLAVLHFVANPALEDITQAGRTASRSPAPSIRTMAYDGGAGRAGADAGRGGVS